MPRSSFADTAIAGMSIVPMVAPLTPERFLNAGPPNATGQPAVADSATPNANVASGCGNNKK